MGEQTTGNRQAFRAFLRSPDVPHPICMPLCSSLFPQSYAEGVGGIEGGLWDLEQNLAAARACGYIPDKLLYDNMYVFDGDHPLGWHVETVGEYDGQPLTESRIETPLGPLVKRNKVIVDGRAEKDHVIQTEEDLRKAEWLIRARTDAVADVADGMRDARRIVGDEMVLIYLVAQPFEIGYVGAALEDCILLVLDFPDAFQRCMDAGREQARVYIRAVAEAGVDLLLIDSPGTELFSPTYFETYSIESSREMVSWAHASDLPVSFHTCGRAWTYICKGYYNRILPDIFESTSGPPEGDVPDQRQARDLFDPRIALRGSVSLDLLRRGTPEQVYDEATRIMTAFRGHRHILAGTCETMNGTPPENMKAMVKACDDWSG